VYAEFSHRAAREFFHKQEPKKRRVEREGLPRSSPEVREEKRRNETRKGGGAEASPFSNVEMPPPREAADAMKEQRRRKDLATKKRRRRSDAKLRGGGNSVSSKREEHTNGGERKKKERWATKIDAKERSARAQRGLWNSRYGCVLKLRRDCPKRRDENRSGVIVGEEF